MVRGSRFLVRESRLLVWESRLLGVAPRCTAAYRLCRNRYYTFVGELRSEGERGTNVFSAKRGILAEDTFCALARREVVEDDVHGNTRAAHAGESVHPFRIDPDMLTPIHQSLRGTERNIRRTGFECLFPGGRRDAGLR